MADTRLRRQVEQILDALPETATLEDLLCALEVVAGEALEADAHDSAIYADEPPEAARAALGLGETCSARRRRAAGDS